MGIRTASPRRGPGGELVRSGGVREVDDVLVHRRIRALLPDRGAHLTERLAAHIRSDDGRATSGEPAGQVLTHPAGSTADHGRRAHLWLALSRLRRTIAR